MARVEEAEVVIEVDLGEPLQICERLVEGESAAVEVDVECRASRWHPREHAGAALEQPLGVAAFGEHAAEEAIEVLQPDPFVDVQRRIGGRGLAGFLFDRSLDASGG